MGTRISPTELQWKRKSHLGFTGAELVFLTQWLRSSSFPYDFTFPGLVTPPPELLEKYNALKEQYPSAPGAPTKPKP